IRFGSRPPVDKNKFCNHYFRFADDLSATVVTLSGRRNMPNMLMCQSDELQGRVAADRVLRYRPKPKPRKGHGTVPGGEIAGHRPCRFSRALEYRMCEMSDGCGGTTSMGGVGNRPAEQVLYKV